MKIKICIILLVIPIALFSNLRSLNGIEINSYKNEIKNISKSVLVEFWNDEVISLKTTDEKLIKKVRKEYSIEGDSVLTYKTSSAEFSGNSLTIQSDLLIKIRNSGLTKEEVLNQLINE